MGENVHKFYVSKLSSAVHGKVLYGMSLLCTVSAQVCRLCCKSATTVDFHRTAVIVPETSNWRECIGVEALRWPVTPGSSVTPHIHRPTYILTAC